MLPLLRSASEWGMNGYSDFGPPCPTTKAASAAWRSRQSARASLSRPQYRKICDAFRPVRGSAIALAQGRVRASGAAARLAGITTDLVELAHEARGKALTRTSAIHGCVVFERIEFLLRGQMPAIHRSDRGLRLSKRGFRGQRLRRDLRGGLALKCCSPCHHPGRKGPVYGARVPDRAPGESADDGSHQPDQSHKRRTHAIGVVPR